jgi:hypothetical protein
MLTTADFEKMFANPEWEGFGYLGERTREDREDLVAAADAQVLADANEMGLTAEQLFVWANSKAGRWFGDCVFGGHGQHAERYLPSANLFLFS